VEIRRGEEIYSDRWEAGDQDGAYNDAWSRIAPYSERATSTPHPGSRGASMHLTLVPTGTPLTTIENRFFRAGACHLVRNHKKSLSV
jgi:hypothetical protein